MTTTRQSDGARLGRGADSASRSCAENLAELAASRSRLHLQREFAHVAKTVGGIDRDRPLKNRLEPRRKIRAQYGEFLRSVSARLPGGAVMSSTRVPDNLSLCLNDRINSARFSAERSLG